MDQKKQFADTKPIPGLEMTRESRVKTEIAAAADEMYREFKKGEGIVGGFLDFRKTILLMGHVVERMEHGYFSREFLVALIKDTEANALRSFLNREFPPAI